MKLIIGLGNPDSKYKKTRHNIGFRTLDKLIKMPGYEGLEFKDDKKFFGQTAKNSKFFLLKPMTYMNKSGQSVLAMQQYFKIDLNDMLVVHDDMDLNFGQIKLQQNKSAAGHNGVDSIISSINSNGFWRLRIGINNGLKEKISGEKFVISNFSKKEEELLPQLINPAIDLIKEFITHLPSDLTNKNLKIAV